ERDQRANVLDLVAGKTHPLQLRQAGERMEVAETRRESQEKRPSQSEGNRGDERADKVPGIALVSQNLVPNMTADVEVAVRAESHADRVVQRVAGSEDAHRGAGRAVEARHVTRGLVGDVEVAVGAESQLIRQVQRAARGEDVQERPGRAVIAQ